MKYRTMNESDIEPCGSIFAKVFASEPWNENWIDAISIDRLSHFYHSKGFLGVVAEREHIVGFALGNIEPFYFGPMYYLREMCVSMIAQGEGVGSKMLDALERELSDLKVKQIYLATDRLIPAASFYKGKGFLPSKTLAFYSKTI